jgi:hypothetical protein
LATERHAHHGKSLYTRARAAIFATKQGKYQFTLEAIDIDGQAELVAEYGERVPVVLIDGKERFWGRINGVLLERALRSR